ncbi:MAG: hypothetical protein ACK5X3_20060, partial [Pseudomonadota bacterium]
MRCLPLAAAAEALLVATAEQPVPGSGAVEFEDFGAVAPMSARPPRAARRDPACARTIFEATETDSSMLGG